MTPPLNLLRGHPIGRAPAGDMLTHVTPLVQLPDTSLLHSPREVRVYAFDVSETLSALRGVSI